MTQSTKSGIRRALSLAAFTTLIAAVTLAFADAPQGRSSVAFDQAKPAMSKTPLAAVRLAEAPSKSKARPVAKAPTPSASKKALEGVLNINLANSSELAKLPGIGPKKADRIVEWRSQNGKFKRVVDLRRVKGFGAKSVKKLLPYLSVSGKSTLH